MTADILIPGFYHPSAYAWVMDASNKRGGLVPVRRAVISAFSKAAQYGTGSVFEGIRANNNGVCFKLSAHIERFFNSARMIQAAFPKGFTPEVMADAIEVVTKANARIIGKNALYVRPWAGVMAEEAGINPGDHPAAVDIGAWEWKGYFGEKQSLSLDIADWRKPDPRSVPVEAKAGGNYVINGLSKKTAKEERGCDDALMLHLNDTVAEATGANVFFVEHDGTLSTPIAKGRMLNGITRQTMIDEVIPHLRLSVCERDIHVDTIPSMRAAFLVGTAAEVAPVDRIKDHVMNPDDEIVQRIRAAYAQLFEAQTTRHHQTYEQLGLRVA
jgi:branched-chain amino acid aminotransferase